MKSVDLYYDRYYESLQESEFYTCDFCGHSYNHDEFVEYNNRGKISFLCEECYKSGNVTIKDKSYPQQLEHFSTLQH